MTISMLTNTSRPGAVTPFNRSAAEQTEALSSRQSASSQITATPTTGNQSPTDRSMLTVDQQAALRLNQTEQATGLVKNSGVDQSQANAPANDSVRVSSTLGKAASSGLLTKDEAMAIYQKIAAFL